MRDTLFLTVLALALALMANSSDAGIISTVDNIGTSNHSSVDVLQENVRTVDPPTFGGTYPAAAFLVDVKKNDAAHFSFTVDSTADYSDGNANDTLLSFPNNTGKGTSSLQLSRSGGPSIFGDPCSGDTYAYPSEFGSRSVNQIDSGILAQSSIFSWNTPVTPGNSLPIILSDSRGNPDSFYVSLLTAVAPKSSSIALMSLSGSGPSASGRRRAKSRSTCLSSRNRPLVTRGPLLFSNRNTFRSVSSHQNKRNGTTRLRGQESSIHVRRKSSVEEFANSRSKPSRFRS